MPSPIPVLCNCSRSCSARSSVCRASGSLANSGIWLTNSPRTASRSVLARSSLIAAGDNNRLITTEFELIERPTVRKKLPFRNPKFETNSKSCSWQKIHFLGVGPNFPFGSSGGQRRLAGVGFFPPALRLRVGSHPLHISIEIFAPVLEVSEKIQLPFNLSLVNREVLDMTRLDHAVHAWPWMRMEIAIVFGFLGLQTRDPNVSLHFGGSAACKQSKGQREQSELDFHFFNEIVCRAPPSGRTRRRRELYNWPSLAIPTIGAHQMDVSNRGVRDLPRRLWARPG